MTHKLPELPFAKNALTPYLSPETIEYHYGKHHAAYVLNLNKLVVGTEFENSPPEEIIRRAAGPLYNNAAQHWNHSFYWNSLTPKSGGEPAGALGETIKKSFGSFAKFKEEFTAAAVTFFGSGWVWLIRNPDGSLAIGTTANAGNPLKDDKKALLTCDVWEHAYYIDYRNNRAGYIEAFFKIANWKFAEDNYKA
jgi:Fe-Mn family superoxide dismutase